VVVPGERTEPESLSWRRPTGWTAVGLGAVGLGLGTYFAVDGSDAAAQTRGLRPRDARAFERLSDQVDRDNLGAAISYSIGGTLLLAGAMILLWPDTRGSLYRDYNEFQNPEKHGDGRER